MCDTFTNNTELKYRSDLGDEKGLGVIVGPLAKIFGTVGDGNEHPRQAMVVGRKQHHVRIPVRQRLYDSTRLAGVDGLVAEVHHRSENPSSTDVIIIFITIFRFKEQKKKPDSKTNPNLPKQKTSE